MEAIFGILKYYIGRLGAFPYPKEQQIKINNITYLEFLRPRRQAPTYVLIVYRVC